MGPALGRKQGASRGSTLRGRRAEQIEPVRRVEITRAAAGDVRVTVLPDDSFVVRVDDDHPVVVVVVRGDEAVREPYRKRRLGQLVRPARRPERPGHPAGPSQLDDLSRRREARYEDAAVRQELRIGRIHNRRAHRPHQPAPSIEAVDPPGDLRHEQAPVP